MPGDYGVITLRGSRSESKHDLGKTKITRQTCCIHQDLSGKPSLPKGCPAFPHSSFSEWEIPPGRNLRGGRDRDETFHLAYQTFLGSSSRLPAAPSMGRNGSAHPGLGCHQILASLLSQVEPEGDVEGARFVNQPQAPGATLIQTLPNPGAGMSPASQGHLAADKSSCSGLFWVSQKAAAPLPPRRSWARRDEMCKWHGVTHRQHPTDLQHPALLAASKAAEGILPTRFRG